VLAVVSILYGSVLAFSQDEARLVMAYSSIAQLGFIVLGIFSLSELGAQGALMQMVNHGLVVGALFFIIAVLTTRAAESPSLAEMGGMALRAPVLAALFLIVALATLAMPGSPNFVGEILILFGTFEDKLVYGLIASLGVVLAAVYMIRIFQQSMHNRDATQADPRELGALDFAVIAPLAAVIVALGVYPQVLLDRTDEATTSKVEAAQRVANGEPSTAEAAPAEDAGGAAAPGGAPAGGQQLTPEQQRQLQQQLQEEAQNASPGGAPQGGAAPQVGQPGATPQGAQPGGAPPQGAVPIDPGQGQP
jgi:NADH-quinone oxidoreductase subunit M